LSTDYSVIFSSVVESSTGVETPSTDEMFTSTDGKMTVLLFASFQKV